MDCVRSIGAATYTVGGGRTVYSAARTNGGWPIAGLRGRYYLEPQQMGNWKWRVRKASAEPHRFIVRLCGLGARADVAAFNLF